ncbi:MAG: hypothetical protein JXB30_04465 [Anaerolineae bacterium]|nr:hypothetical protein [Anaerolineae bacterium]
MTEELQKAVELLRDGDILAARRLLSDIVKVDPNNEQAWLWLSSAVTDEERRRECLERVLRINPGNQAAHLALVALSQPSELPPDKKPQLNPEPQPPGFGTLRDSAAAAFRSVSRHRRESAPVTNEISDPVEVPQAVIAPASKAISPSRILGNVWINPTGRPDKIVILHDDSLIVSNPGRRALRRFESDVTAGMLHLDLLGKDMLLIPYNSITRVIADERRPQLIVRFRGGRRMLSENIRFAGTGLRDEVFQAIKDDAGSRFDLIHVKQGGFWRSIPYVLIAGLLSYLTYDAYVMTRKIANGWTFAILESSPQLKTIAVQFAQSYGPICVVIFGAMLVLATLLWVLLRASKPREMPVLRAR